MSGPLKLQVMGPLRVWRDGAELDPGPRQQRALLALLLALEDRPVSMTDLVHLIWGDQAPASAVNVVHKYVGTLRRLFEPDLPFRSSGSYLIRQGTGYRFTAGPEELDLVAFRALAARARKSEEEGRSERAFDEYVRALRGCEGPAGDALADTPAAAAVFAALDSEFLDAAVAAAGLAVQVGRPAVLLPVLRRAAELGPLHEPVHASLATTLAAAGHQAEALNRLRAIRERLGDELGIDPGQELREAQRRVLTQDVPLSSLSSGPVLPVEAAEPRAPETFRPVPLVRPAQLPPDQPLFVGREAELGVLSALADGMDAPGRTSPLVIAVDGMGGVGKSTIVTHFAHQVAERFRDGQLYLDLRGHDEDESVPAGDALRSFVYALGMRGSDIPDSFDALTGTYRSLTAGRRMLFLLDNVRDPSQVRPLLPNSADCLVLITSRRSPIGLAASDGAHLMRVEVPERPEARTLLAARLNPDRRRNAAGEAGERILDELVESCGRLPLALAILGARLSARPQLALSSVAATLRDNAHRLEAFPGGGGVSDPRTAFSWSYRQLSPGAARLFRLLALSLSPGITLPACVSLSGQDRPRTAAELGELAEAALVSEDEAGRFTSHVLVRTYAEELLAEVEQPAEREAALGRLLEHYLHSSLRAEQSLELHGPPVRPPAPRPGVVVEQPVSYREALAWFVGHRDVLKEAVRVAADNATGVAAWHLAVTMQKYLEWYGFFRDWEDVTRIAVRAAREQDDVIAEAHVLRSLAGARWYAGANQEALGLLDAALAVFAERGLLAEQAAVQVNRHAVHTALGEHELALADSEQAVDLNRRAGNRRGEIRSLDGKGQALTRLGRHEEADQVLQHALELNSQIRYRHEDAAIRVAIARNQAATGRMGEAVRQLRIAAGTAGEMSQGPYRFDAFQGLAEVLVSLGDVEDAREALGQAFEVLDAFQDGGPDHMRAALQPLVDRLAEIEKAGSAVDLSR